MKKNADIHWEKVPAPKFFLRDSENNILMDSNGNPKIQYLTKKKYEIPISDKEVISIKDQIERIALQSIVTSLAGFSFNLVAQPNEYNLSNSSLDKYDKQYNALRRWIGVFSWEAFFQHIVKFVLLLEHKEDWEDNTEKSKEVQADYLQLLRQSRIIITDNPDVIWDQKREELLVDYFLTTENPEKNIGALLLMHLLTASDIFENYDHNYPDEEKNGYSPKKFVLNPNSYMMKHLLETTDLLDAFQKSAIKKMYGNHNDKFSSKQGEVLFREAITNSAILIATIITSHEFLPEYMDCYFYREIFRTLCNDVFFNVFDRYWSSHEKKFSRWTVNNRNYETLFYFPYQNVEYIHLLHDFCTNEIIMPYDVYKAECNRRKTEVQKTNPRKGSLKNLFNFRYSNLKNCVPVSAKKEQTRIIKAYSKILQAFALENKSFFEDIDKFQKNSPENHYNLINIMNFCDFCLCANDAFDYEIYKNSFIRLKAELYDPQKSICSQNKFIYNCFLIQPESYWFFIANIIETFSVKLKDYEYSLSELYPIYWKLEERRYRIKNPTLKTIDEELDFILAPRE